MNRLDQREMREGWEDYNMNRLDQREMREQLLSLARQKLAMQQPSSSAPTKYYGVETREPTADEQNAFTNRMIFKAEYGRPDYKGGYSGGLRDRMIEAAKQKAQLELRRNALKDKQSAEKHQLEIAKSAREQEKHDLEKSGQWGGLAGGEGKDTTLQTSGTPLTKGVPDKMKTIPPAGAIPNPQTLPSQGEAVQAAPLGTIPTQTGPVPQPGPMGGITIPGGSARWDSKVAAPGTYNVPREYDPTGSFLPSRIAARKQKEGVADIAKGLKTDEEGATKNSQIVGMKGLPMGPTGGAGGTFDTIGPSPAKKKREELLQAIGQGGSDIGSYVGSGLAKGTIWGDIGSLARRSLMKLSPFNLY